MAEGAAGRARRRLAFAMALIAGLLSGALATADDRTVGGVELPGTVAVAGETLRLNGAGVRKRFFFSVYVGALYTAAPMRDAGEVLRAEAPRRIHLVMLRHVDRATMVEALEEGLQRTMTEQQRTAHAGDIAAFRALFPADFNEGDRIAIDAVPGDGVMVRRGGDPVGRVDSDRFARHVLAIWLGDPPADTAVKRGMLGGG